MATSRCPQAEALGGRNRHADAVGQDRGRMAGDHRRNPGAHRHLQPPPFPPRTARSGRSSRSRTLRLQKFTTRTGPGRRSTASSWPQLEAKGLRPSGPADKRALLRRATFDLIGLPPTPEEVEAFVADESPDAFERVVDRLLESPRYGERWGTALARRRPVRRRPGAHLRGPPVSVRISVSRLGRQGVERRHALRRVRRATRSPATCSTAPMPMTGRSPPRACSPWDRFITVGPSWTNTTTASTRSAGDSSGLTVACARCHDHKFDPIAQADYYALAGIFASTATRNIPKHRRNCRRATTRPRPRSRRRTPS